MRKAPPLCTDYKHHNKIAECMNTTQDLGKQVCWTTTSYHTRTGIYHTHRYLYQLKSQGTQHFPSPSSLLLGENSWPERGAQLCSTKTAAHRCRHRNTDVQGARHYWLAYMSSSGSCNENKFSKGPCTRCMPLGIEGAVSRCAP